MRLTINRSWSGSFGGGTYRLDLIDEEQRLVEKFSLGSRGVSVGHKNITFANLIHGVTIEPSGSYHIASASLLERQLITNCDEFYRLLDFCRSFEETVVEFPRT